MYGGGGGLWQIKHIKIQTFQYKMLRYIIHVFYYCIPNQTLHFDLSVNTVEKCFSIFFSVLTLDTNI